MVVPGRGSPCMPSWEACKRILSCASFEEISGSVLRPLAEAVNANRGVFLQFVGLPLRGVLLGRQTYLGDENKLATDIYASDGLYVDDPLLQPTLAWLTCDADRCGTALTLLSRVPDWRDHSIYSRFLHRFDVGHVLAVAIPTITALGREMLCMGLHRPEEAAPFSDEDVCRLEGFMPVIQSVVSNLAYQEAMRLSGTVINELSDAYGGLGLVLLDHDLQIRQTNRRAMEQFRTCDALTGAIRKSLLDAPPPAVGTESETTLALNEHGSRHQNLINMHVRAFQSPDGHTFYLASMREAEQDGDPKHAAAHFGLSKREGEVAILVCQGKSNPAIGSELGITYRTVENHLRTVYQKVGVKSRTQLVSRLFGTREHFTACT